MNRPLISVFHGSLVQEGIPEQLFRQKTRVQEVKKRDLILIKKNLIKNKVLCLKKEVLLLFDNS